MTESMAAQAADETGRYRNSGSVFASLDEMIIKPTQTMAAVPAAKPSIPSRRFIALMRNATNRQVATKSTSGETEPLQAPAREPKCATRANMETETEERS